MITLNFSSGGDDEVGEGVFRAVQSERAMGWCFNDAFKKEDYDPRNIVEFTVTVKEAGPKE